MFSISLLERSCEKKGALTLTVGIGSVSLLECNCEKKVRNVPLHVCRRAVECLPSRFSLATGILVRPTLGKLSSKPRVTRQQSRESSFHARLFYAPRLTDCQTLAQLFSILGKSKQKLNSFSYIMDVAKNMQDGILVESKLSRFNHNKLTICCSINDDTDDDHHRHYEQQLLQRTPPKQECCKTRVDNQSELDANHFAPTSRDFRLFEHWIDRATPAMSVYCRYATPNLDQFNPSTDAFLVPVDFDYNQKNFRPVKLAPEIIRLGDIVSINNGSYKFQNPDMQTISTGYVKYKEYVLKIPVFLDFGPIDDEVSVDEDDDDAWDSTESVRRQVEYGQEQLRHKMFNNIRLESSVFDNWNDVEKANRHKSYQHIVSNDDFARFMIHVLHEKLCSDNAHQDDNEEEDYLVVLVVTFGFDLGQIDSIDQFFVLSRTKAVEKLGLWYNLTRKHTQRFSYQCQLPVIEMTTTNENNKHDPNETYTTIILLAHASLKMFVQHIPVPSLMTNNDPWGEEQCVHHVASNDSFHEQAALYYFTKLQARFPVPKQQMLPSPDLNEM